MISKIIFRTGWRYLFRHRSQSLLMVAGIILGVSVVVSIDIANVSASRAFELSTEAVTGGTTSYIIGGPEGIAESLYSELRVSGFVKTAAPVISEYVTSPEIGNRPLQLIGVDPFVEESFRDFPVGDRPGSFAKLILLINQPDTILISANLANEFGISSCPSFEPSSKNECGIQLNIGGFTHLVRIIGLIEPSNDGHVNGIQQAALDEIILTDISTAQELTGRVGRLDRIDLILPNDCYRGLGTLSSPIEAECIEADVIRSHLPSEANLVSVEGQSGNVQEMTSAFKLNLTALSLLALIVGMFLIYNTMTFSVLQRRRVFGILRSIGVTRQEIFVLILGEALLIGVIGAVAGVLLGVLLGQLTIHLVTQTINDLYFVVAVRGVQVPWSSLMKGLILGILATVIAAIPPAWEAASSHPREVLTRVVIEEKAVRGIKLAGWIGLLMIIIGISMLWLPFRNLVLGFAGTLFVILGFALLAPITTRLVMTVILKVFGNVLGALGRMAPREVNNSLSRTAVAVAALTIALSVTIGISVMVNSFRRTVITWLDETLAGDIYISVPSYSGNQLSSVLDPTVISKAREYSNVERVDALRSVNLTSSTGQVHVAATDNPSLVYERIFVTKIGSLEELNGALDAGAVLISEPLANRLGLGVNPGMVTLSTRAGWREFPIAGVYYDYASSQGTILMRLSSYREHWFDSNITALSLRLAPGEDPDLFANRLAGDLSQVQNLEVRPNASLRQDVLEVFDRTFVITGALRFLAILVAFIGILNALLSWQLEKKREAGILRSLGLTKRQLSMLILTETGLMGSVAGLLSIPAGITLAAILVYIINRRSFGWTIQLQFEVWPFILAILISLAASMLAGIIPARKLSLIHPAEALQVE